jgi:pyruvate ferredoxin oxidoreductase alpha subunit
MSQRDSGWIQLYAESNQEAVDLHVQAFRLAEELELPVLVCMDGFVLTHAVEPVELPGQAAVDAFLPPFSPRQRLDPADPVTIGAMVGPDAFMEVRYLMHAKQRLALERIPALADEFAGAFGRTSGGLVRGYRLDDAEIAIVALGSVLGSVEDLVDARRAEGERVGALAIRCFRPAPLEQIRGALMDMRRVVVVEKAFAAGAGGVVGQDVRLALQGTGVPVHDVIAGLGGRPVTAASLRPVVAQAAAGTLPDLSFLDLRHDVVERELGRLAGAAA